MDNKKFLTIIAIDVLLTILSVIWVIFLGFSIWLYISWIFWLMLIWAGFEYSRFRINLKMFLVVISCFVVTYFLLATLAYWQKFDKSFSQIGKTENNQTKVVSNNEKGSIPQPGNNFDCQNEAKKYDGKILKITSVDGLKGQIGIKINRNNCEYEITWQSLFNSANFKRSNQNDGLKDYLYVADLVFEGKGGNPADGTISPVFAHKEDLPVDPFNYRIPYTFYVTDEILAGKNKTAETTTFSHVMQQTGTLSEKTIPEILRVKKLNIYDGGPFTTIKKTEQGLPYNSVDQEATVTKGHITASYNLQISE